MAVSTTFRGGTPDGQDPLPVKNASVSGMYNDPYFGHGGRDGDALYTKPGKAVPDWHRLSQPGN